MPQKKTTQHDTGMNAREQTRRYTAAELLVSGVVAGLRLQAPAKWIVRQATVRSAVASCVYMSGMAFLLSMVAADFLGSGTPPTHAQNMLLYYPLCVIVQLLCSPRHKLIAVTVQQKSQLAATKRWCFFFSLSLATTLLFTTCNLTHTHMQQDVTRAVQPQTAQWAQARLVLRQQRQQHRQPRTTTARAASGSCWRC